MLAKEYLARASFTAMNDLKWSQTEKAVARKAFNQAVERELEAIIHKTKQMASSIESPSQLWELEDYLSKSRKTLDEKYDYRYSVLPLVFAKLIRQRRLRWEDLHGLGEDKLRYVRAYVQL